MDPLAYIAIAVMAYLLGSIPTGFLVAKARGIDIRTVGSGNIGATNAMRVLGKPSGIFVLLMDALKGWIACRPLAYLFWNKLGNPSFNLGPDIIVCGAMTPFESYSIIAGLAAITGHIFTCWLKFKGGKGVATTGGVMLALSPLGFLMSLGVWIVVAATSRYVSVASIAAAVSLPVAVWLTNGDGLLIAVFAVIGALAIWKHKANIQRLRDGTESRIGSKPKTDPISPPL